jgi:hypothetical protein
MELPTVIISTRNEAQAGIDEAQATREGKIRPPYPYVTKGETIRRREREIPAEIRRRIATGGWGEPERISKGSRRFVPGNAVSSRGSMKVKGEAF